MATDGVVVSLPARPSDDAVAFVLAGWLNSYMPRGLAVHGLDREDSRDRRTYYATHHPEFTRLLRASTLALAVLAEEPDVFLGWALGKPGLLHYVYVKSDARGHGIASDLVRAVAGEGTIIHTFEPARATGKANANLLAVAARKGWRFHPHPIPGIAVHKQREQRA